MQTFAILGSHPKLSIAEIESVIGIKLAQSSDEVAVFDTDIDACELQSVLGGTQKLGEVLGSVKNTNEIKEHIHALLLDASGDKKLRFGISVYNFGDEKRTKELQKYTKKIGLELKKELKASGISARLVTSSEPTLSAVVVQKNKMINEGIEFVILAGKNEIHIGKTLSIQDFEDWSRRDYDRPRRDAKSGMLPPKLARIMVNLSGINPKQSYLLDPFCGSGTILMEASLLGFDNVIGSDISQKAIDDTRINLDWLMRQNYYVADHTLVCSSADYLGDKLEDELVDTIVTEPFLGNPRSGNEEAYEIKRTIESLSGLYESSFGELKKVLAPSGIVVMASPVHFIGDEKYHVPTEQIMKKLGFKLTDGPFLYKREGQFVGREILVFESQD